METNTLSTSTKWIIALAILLLLAGLFIPLWYVAIAGLLLLSAIAPFIGVCAGFLLDIIYGAPPILPLALGYPCMLASCAVGVLSFMVRTYIR